MTTPSMRLARAEGRLVRELKTIIELALPMMLAQGGLMAMGVVDTLMVGRVSSLEMSAVALGGSIAGVIVVFGIGLAMGIEPLVSQANGAGDPARGRAWMWQGLYLCALISIPLAILTAVSTLLLEPLGIPRDIAERSNMYVWGRMPGILANCLYAVLRSYLSALGRPRPVLFAVLAANVLNVFLDWILIFGLLGLPALGGTGAGIATSIAWTFMTIVLAVAIARMPVPGTPSQAPISRRMRYEDMATISRIGWPIGMQIAAEVGIFALVSALIARFGDVQLAGHQIAITVASLSFMAAVGIANATTARVGHWIGAEDSPMARRAGFVGIVLGGSFMAACGLSYLIFREPLATLFAPNDPAAAAVGADLLVIAAAFAIFDGIQAVSAGALRGAGDTRWTFYANAIGHWLIALPMAIYLGHERGLGTVGYWWALTAGLIGAAAILTARFVVISKKQMARVEA